MTPAGLPKDGHWIYLIVNGVDGKVYVGKTRRMYSRCHQYLYDFRERAIGHLNNHLFNAMTKHGIDQFQMLPWEQCESDAHAVVRELFWMDHFDSTNRNVGYNLRRDSQRGMITHPETSAKIRANLTEQWRNGVRDNHGVKLKANWAQQPAARRASQANVMKRNLTKYTYVVSQPDEDMQLFCDYAKLRAYGLGSALSSFMRQKSDVIELKGHIIRRVAACPN